MIVSELREILGKYPDDMEVITTCWSDMTSIDKKDIEMVSAVDKDFYFMRSHPTMDAKLKEKERLYLRIL